MTWRDRTRPYDSGSVLSNAAATRGCFDRRSAPAFIVGLAFVFAFGARALATPPSELRELGRVVVASLENETVGEIHLVVSERTLAGNRGMRRAARVTARTESGEFLDGSGRGLYADGRFFIDGECTLRAPPGKVRLSIRTGPEHVPLDAEVTATRGDRVYVEALLSRWISLRDRGWYDGDNHVHAQHDRNAAVRTSLEFAALQARAGGLAYITEAGSHLSYANAASLSRPDFLFGSANELRPGCFAGHLNTPGIARAVDAETLRHAETSPLPIGALLDPVHSLGGAVIHTHLMVPPHQLHWMGATELLSGTVLGRTADAVDLDFDGTRLLWFAALNLGSRIAASASTDCALGRRRTPSPGDRRVYARSGVLSLAAIARALRAGRSVATSGGPLFAELSVDGQGPGGTTTAGATPHEVEARLDSLHQLRFATLYWRGQPVAELDVNGERGTVDRRARVEARDANADGWFVLHAEDERGDWVLTSPVYVKGAATPPGRENEHLSPALALIEISNATRFIELRREFFAHAIVTVRENESLDRAELLRDGASVRVIRAANGDERAGGRVPVTELRGEYAPGWIWHPEPARAQHVAADWRIDASGWYAVRATTRAGRTVESDAVYFDAEHETSHALSAATLSGGDTEFRWWGYGEEMPLDAIELPFEGDRWWFPKNTAWRVEARFGSHSPQTGGGPNQSALRLFRRRGNAAPAPPQRRTSLLAGPALDEFYSWLHASHHRDPERVFASRNGRLRISGEGFGYLGTRRAYRDYRLTLEYRWGDRNWRSRSGKARDAGVFLHAVGPDGNSHDGDGAFRSAIECQIMEGATGDLMLIRGDDERGDLIPLALTAEVRAAPDSDGWPYWEDGGTERTIETWGRLNWFGKDPAWEDRFGFRGADDRESPAGEWTRLEITCAERTIEVRVNGAVVNRATNVVPSAGQILLQCEGSEIEFRRIDIEPLRARSGGILKSNETRESH